MASPLSQTIARIYEKKYGIKANISKPAKMPNFWPANPYDLEVNNVYLYHLREPTWDGRINPSPPEGDYIIQFIRYRPPTYENTEVDDAGDFIHAAFGDYPCAWKLSTKLSASTSKLVGIKENRIFAQFLFLCYRPNPQSKWGRIDGFEWNSHMGMGSVKIYSYLEIDANNMGKNMLFNLSDESSSFSRATISRATSSTVAPEAWEKFQDLIRLLEPESGAVGVVDSDLIINLDEPPPEPPILTRQISETFSDQMREGTCIAHTMARVALKIIRNYIPHWFGDLSERSYCNSSYNVPMMKNISYHVSLCNRIDSYRLGERYSKAGNNFLLFTYLYKYIINKTGCNGNFASALYRIFIRDWFTKDLSGLTDDGHARTANSSFIDKSSLFRIDKEFADRKNVSCIGADINISPRDKKQISKMLQAFDAAFFRDPANQIELKTHNLNPSETSHAPVFDHDAQEYIKYSLDYNYYVIIQYRPTRSPLNHVVVVVGYEIVADSMILIIKNSWGDLTGQRDTTFMVNYNRSTLKKKANDVKLEGGVIYIMLPSSLMRAMETAISARFAERQRLIGLVVEKSNRVPQSPDISPPLPPGQTTVFESSSPDLPPPTRTTVVESSSPDLPPPRSREGSSHPTKHQRSNSQSNKTRRNTHKK